MGFFSSDSKSNQSSSKSSAAGQSQTGDPISISVSGGNKSYTNLHVNNYQTDFGSVEKSFSLAEQAINLAGQLDESRGKSFDEALSKTVALVQSESNAGDNDKTIYLAGGIALVMGYVLTKVA